MLMYGMLAEFYEGMFQKVLNMEDGHGCRIVTLKIDLR
jgi:hypothetical protein